MEIVLGVWLLLVCALSCGFALPGISALCCVSLPQFQGINGSQYMCAMLPNIQIMSVKYKQTGLCLQP